MPFEVDYTDQMRIWMAGLGAKQRHSLLATIEALVIHGPTLGRPLADRVKRSRVHKLKELRPPSTSVRVLFAFDSNRKAILLYGGDKSNNWNRWYPSAIAKAERSLADHERSLGKGVTWESTRTGARSSAR